MVWFWEQNLIHNKKPVVFNQARLQALTPIPSLNLQNLGKMINLTRIGRDICQ